MWDYVPWEAQGLFIVVEFEGNTLKRSDLVRERPAFKMSGSTIAKRLMEYVRTGTSDYSGFTFDLSGFSEFEKAVLGVTAKIPAGMTMTYSQVAAAAGYPKAARAAGNAVSKNPLCPIIPCHRVVAANGIGGFYGDIEVKKALLRLEGTI